MELYCTRPGCPRPTNGFADIDDPATLRTVQQKFCTSCGMPLILGGRYIPLKLLGKGGFGAAYLARDRYTPAMRPCVVKLFQPSANLSPQQLQIAQNLFEREGQVLEDLGNRHPQIPDLLAFFEVDAPGRGTSKVDRFFYLAQEYIDGKTLEEELTHQGPFSEAAIIEILTEILPVLKFVHEHDSIHRDIKPSNIMRRRDGRLYLLDFGAVKQLTAAAISTRGKASTGIYSVGFAPPEQMRGDVVYPATDLYALAVTCLMLLTGQQPEDLYDTYSNAWKWRSFAQVSDRLGQVLDRMLLPTPSDRFPSAQATLDALNLPPPSAPPHLPATPHPAPSSASSHPPSAPPPHSTTLQSPPFSAAPAPPAPLAAAPPATPAPSAPPASPSRPSFALPELLANAAFTGFESGLLAIALLSLVGTTVLTPLFWLVLVGILVLAQSRRWIERIDLIILASVTLAIVLLIPMLRTTVLAGLLGGALPSVLIVAGLAALAAVFITILFRIIYLVVSSIL